jgi:ribosomal protein S12 methylthiotransferase accessory factor
VDITFTLGAGTRIKGHTATWSITTDQPPDDSLPTPFALFLASIGACAAFYVQSFCRQRGIPVDDIRVLQHSAVGPSGRVERVHLAVELPPEFPERYRDAVIRAAGQCTVKKHLEHPPVIDIETRLLNANLPTVPVR